MAGGLTRWDPLAEITQLRSRFGRLLDELGGQDHGAWMPAIDLVRHDDDLVVRVDLPGIKPAEVRVEVDDGLLTVSGEHEERRSEKDDDGRYLRRERRLGAFSRSIALPSGVDATAIEAETRDGVVEVTIPCRGPRRAEDRDHAHGRVRRRVTPRPCARGTSLRLRS